MGQVPLVRYFSGETAKLVMDFQDKMKGRCACCACPQIRALLFFYSWAFWILRASQLDKANSFSPENIMWYWPIQLGCITLALNAAIWIVFLPFTIASLFVSSSGSSDDGKKKK